MTEAMKELSDAVHALITSKEKFMKSFSRDMIELKTMLQETKAILSERKC